VTETLGTVVAVRPRWVLLRTQTGEIRCEVPRSLRQGARVQRHVVAVGDRATVDLQPDGHGILRRIEARRTKVSRLSSVRPRREHVIAANVDTLLAVMSVDRPRFYAHTLDRLLVIADVGGVRPAICLNKIDLARPGEVEELIRPYLRLGMPVFPTCALTGLGLDELRGFLTGRETAFLSQSGVGKSALINDLIPGTQQRTDEVSVSSGRGVHTTTRVDYLDLPGGGAVLDTPGVKTLQPCGVDPADLASFFPEFRPYLGACRFNDCLHRGEPECAIETAARAGEISPSRHVSYVRILEGLLLEADGAGEGRGVGVEPD